MTKGIVRKTNLNGRGIKIGIVHTNWNETVVNNLYQRCLDALHDAGVLPKDIVSVQVPGSFELPLAAQHLIKRKKVDAVVTLGCLIKGETMHFEYICESVANGLQQVAIDNNKPVIFGVLCCLNEKQAQIRADKNGKDHGYEWGQTAVEMATLLKNKKQ